MRFFRYEYEVENNFLKATYRVAADSAEIGKDDKSSSPNLLHSLLRFPTLCFTLCCTLDEEGKSAPLCYALPFPLLSQTQPRSPGKITINCSGTRFIWQNTASSTIFISFKTINQLNVFHALTALGTKNNVHSVSTDLLITSYLWHWIKRMH